MPLIVALNFLLFGSFISSQPTSIPPKKHQHHKTCTTLLYTLFSRLYYNGWTKSFGALQRSWIKGRFETEIRSYLWVLI